VVDGIIEGMVQVKLLQFGTLFAVLYRVEVYRTELIAWLIPEL